MKFAKSGGCGGLLLQRLVYRIRSSAASGWPTAVTGECKVEVVFPSSRCREAVCRN